MKCRVGIMIISLAVVVCAIPLARRVWSQGSVEHRFDQLDKNGDGKITPDELPQAAIFQALDLDGDGVIIREEAVQSFRQGRLRAALDGAADGGAATAPASEATSDGPNPPLEIAVRQGPRRLVPGEHGIGRFMADAEFTDIAGKRDRLSDSGSARAMVFAMTSTRCPLSKKYLPTLVELAREYAARRVRFILVNPIATDKVAEMQEAAARFDSPITYVFDADGSLARHLGATSTTDVILIDVSRTVVYQGAIDDQYGFGYAIDAPRYRYLVDALDALLENRPVLVSATAAPGCLLDAKPLAAVDQQVTYAREIARLLQRYCVECHRDGGVAPFPLDSLDDAIAHAPMIREVLERGIMPPWFAAPLEGETVSPWINHRAVSESEKQQLFHWIDSGTPAGDPDDAPQPRSFPDGWLIGKPDAVFEFARPVNVKATGTMPYQNVVVETHLDEDKWVQAIEIRPGNPGVVHHVLVFVQATGEGDGSREGAADERSGYWGIYVPGNSTLVYPDGYARRIPKGAKLRFQVHYTPNGTATEDSTRIGLIFASQPPRHEVKVAGIVNARLSIPAGAENHEVSASIRLPVDVKVLAFLPHMHLRGKAARYDLITAAGTQTMLDIPRYDFNWQLIYRYAEPVSLKAGDTIRFTAWYDNSDKNPANPDPTRTVRWGPQTEDEMHLGYVEYVVPGAEPGDFVPLSPRGRIQDAFRDRLGNRSNEDSSARALFDRLDSDRDGWVTRDEVRAHYPNNPAAAGVIFDRLDTGNNGKLDLQELGRLPRSLQR